VTPSGPPDPLAGLRPWHLPEPVSWWPPAPGWWLVVLGLILALALGARWLVRRHRDGAPARAARRELAELEARLARDGDGSAFARDLSRLLRRFALARFPRREVAGLTGEAWLAFLDAHGGGWAFRTGDGRALAEGPYRPGGDVPAAALAALARDWIGSNTRGRT
jgi:hypothetical protein